MKEYTYELIVNDKASGELVCRVEALSQESLQEQLRKVDSAIAEHEQDFEDCLECDNPHDPNMSCLEAGAVKFNV